MLTHLLRGTGTATTSSNTLGVLVFLIEKKILHIHTLSILLLYIYIYIPSSLTYCNIQRLCKQPGVHSKGSSDRLICPEPRYPPRCMTWTLSRESSFGNPLSLVDTFTSSVLSHEKNCFHYGFRGGSNKNLPKGLQFGHPHVSRSNLSSLTIEKFEKKKKFKQQKKRSQCFRLGERFSESRLPQSIGMFEYTFS